MAAARPNGRAVATGADLSVGVSVVRSTSGSAEGPGGGCWSSCMGCSSPRPQGMLGAPRFVPVKRPVPRGASARVSYPFRRRPYHLAAPMSALAIEVHDLRMRYGADEAVRGI